MAGKNTAVFGIYRDRTSVENAVDTLRQEGFRNTDISVLFPHNEGTKDFAARKATKAPEGTAAGATTGAIVGGGLGWLAGIGALAIPGLGPLIAAGPIVAALAGVGGQRLVLLDGTPNLAGELAICFVVFLLVRRRLRTIAIALILSRIVRSSGRALVI